MDDGGMDIRLVLGETLAEQLDHEDFLSRLPRLMLALTALNIVHLIILTYVVQH